MSNWRGEYDLLARKYKGSMNGQQYVAHMDPYRREVHDLDNENRHCLTALTR